MSIAHRGCTAIGYAIGVVVMIAALGVGGGCETLEQKRLRELEAVAKDWSMTIRASQVIPVFPMTEDLQPGDVFLVQRTVDDQHKAYTEKGFLAIDNTFARLHPSRYVDHYGPSFLLEDETDPVMPRLWLLPGEAASFGRAPGAAFPAYTFSVSKGTGFSAALPIQGVPVGLSLMNSASATGSVTIKDARTYGVAVTDLLEDVSAWAAEEKTSKLLAFYASNPGGESSVNYLRVVNRVYMTGKINVTLNDTSSSSGGLSVGVPKPVELPLLAPPTDSTTEKVRAASAASYTKGLDALNKALKESVVKDAAGNILPGGTLKVVSASARSVSIDETFKRPVVVGYLAFDMAILPGGALGPPFPTHAVLERAKAPSSAEALPGFESAISMRDIGAYSALAIIAGAAAHPDKAAATALKQRIDGVSSAALPATYPVDIWAFTAEGALNVQITRMTVISPGSNPYRTLLTYLAQLESSVDVLTDAAAPALTEQQQSDLSVTRSEINRVHAMSTGLQAPMKSAREIIER